jgi:hypothetical protein
VASGEPFEQQQQQRQPQQPVPPPQQHQQWIHQLDQQQVQQREQQPQLQQQHAEISDALFESEILPGYLRHELAGLTADELEEIMVSAWIRLVLLIASARWFPSKLIEMVGVWVWCGSRYMVVSVCLDDRCWRCPNCDRCWLLLMVMLLKHCNGTGWAER